MILADRSSTTTAAPAHRRIAPLLAVAPGLGLCAAVTAAACGLEAVERHVFGRAWLETLVLAIVLGTAVRFLWRPGPRWHDGIAFSARTVLETAVMLLGAGVSFRTLAEVGPGLLFGIPGVVVLALAASFGLCRLFGLPRRMALLVACGNSICGNSAIAAVAPAIGADAEEVAASIAFTAVLGVAVVLGLPLLAPLLHFSAPQFGILAGLTVYAVPQVVAATAPVGVAAVQIGTLVKLVRVLMLGPVVLGLSLLGPRLCREADVPAPAAHRQARLAAHKVVPWFIVAFLGLATLRTLDMIPAAALAPIDRAANVLTVLSMAALGLGTDMRMVVRAGGRVTAAVTASLVLLGLVAVAFIRGLGIA